MNQLTIEPETLAIMRERGKNWAAYQNIALDSANLGHLQFIQFGPGCTFAEPPAKCPDTRIAIGWRYALVGIVDLQAGKIVERSKENS